MTRATPGVFTISHRVCAEHVPFPGHPERPDRLRAALEGAARHTGKSAAPELPQEEVLAAVEWVHDASLPRRLEAACRSAPAVFDSPDNPISQGTFEAASGAVACALEAVSCTVAGTADRLWVAVRPPGHHALRDRAMGFCFFNTIAIAAEGLLRHGVGPLAVIDIDVHHGNGTQTHFWRREEVFYLSLHQYPAFPGSGGADEIGEGPGRGRNRNFPLAPDSDDGTFCAALDVGLEEIRTVVRPEVVLVSAGFDGHTDDPVASFRLTEDGFRQAGRSIAELAGAKPVISLLEGGYHLHSLRRSIDAYLEGLAGAASS